MVDSVVNLVQKAEFITSATDPSGYPLTGMPEVAFAGRSNVGKSSLINCLLNRRKLVKTSSTPGKTQLINFFSVNDRIGFVDLPGYGYAKVSRSVRERWKPMIETYLRTRETLHGVVLIVDIRRLPSEEDVQLGRFLESLGVPHAPVLMKADKLKRAETVRQMRKLADYYGSAVEEFLPFSAKTRQGRAALWRVILNWVGLEAR